MPPLPRGVRKRGDGPRPFTIDVWASADAAKRTKRSFATVEEAAAALASRCQPKLPLLAVLTLTLALSMKK